MSALPGLRDAGARQAIGAAAPLGIVMLCHANPERAAQIARFWATAECPVVIHLDRRAGAEMAEWLRAALADCPRVGFSPRFACDWGGWSLVAATQAASAQLLAAWPGVDHVLLTSGACLPLRPARELIAWLEARKGTDFIESVSVADASWTVGGLSAERFTLHFPFSWKKQRWLFDRAVALQRALGVAREVPRPLRPHLGSQWWCLSRATLSAILDHPRRKRHDRYFRHVWIPDEAYFQTLARLVSDRVESRSLTLVKFDRNGRPFQFHDDHLPLLRRSDCFMARKIWPRADVLYRHFLSDRTDRTDRAHQPDPQPERITRHFTRATHQRERGRAGLFMQGRFPRDDAPGSRTAAPFTVLSGFSEVFEGFEPWLARATGLRVHGRLFAPQRVRFAGDAETFNGALSASAALRDHDPHRFLSNLIWATRGEHQCFQLSPGDSISAGTHWFMATDPNARIMVIQGAWALPLFRGSYTAPDLRAHLGWLQRREAAFLEILQSRWVRARVRIWTLAECLEAPHDALAMVLRDLMPDARHLLAAAPDTMPAPRPLDGFAAFLRAQRNAGMPLTLLDDYPASDPASSPTEHRIDARGFHHAI